MHSLFASEKGLGFDLHCLVEARSPRDLHGPSESDACATGAAIGLRIGDKSCMRQDSLRELDKLSAQRDVIDSECLGSMAHLRALVAASAR